MKANILWMIFIMFFCGTASPASPEEEACEYFFQALKPLPHKELSCHAGEFESLLDREKHSGCEIMFVTTDGLLSNRTVPSFEATEGSELYGLGWRMNNSLTADGPGTGMFGIERKSLLCIISHSQPAYVDDKGEIIQDETLTIVVQCRKK